MIFIGENKSVIFIKLARMENSQSSSWRSIYECEKMNRQRLKEKY